MSLRNRLVLPVVVFTLAFLVGCGSSSNSATPPPSGGYTNSDFAGTYVFSFVGADFTNSAETDTASIMAAAGVLTADGKGGLTGTIDLDDPQLAEVESATTLVLSGLGATGNYKVTADGRGNGTIRVTVNNVAVSIGIDFVLMSTSHGLITRFDGNGSGSGTLDLQNSSITQSQLASFAFSLTGVDSGLSNPFMTAGAFTLDGNGNITAGIEDFNDDRNSNDTTGLSLTAGSVVLGAAGAAGTAQLSATGSPYGTLSFDVWPIDSTHLKLIETDGFELLAGDAFTQQTSISSGQLVYTMAGLDTGGFLLSSGGFMSYDPTSNAIGPNGTEDINDSGTVVQSLTVSGTLTPTSGGRYSLSLSGFYNGAGEALSYNFAAYPYVTAGNVVGLLLIETDNLGITGGSAFLQTSQTFASAQGYGLNLTGSNSDGEVDSIAEFTANSDGTLTNGLIDENDEGGLSFDQQLGTGGTYTFDPTNSGRGELSYPSTDTTLIGELDLFFYVANNSTVIFIEEDSGQASVGSFELQTGGGTNAKAAVSRTQSHFSTLKAVAQARAARGKK
jgi:hypothetical protein